MENILIKKDAGNTYQLNCLIGQGKEAKVIDLAKKLDAWIEKKKGEILEIEKKIKNEEKGGKSEFWVEKRRLAYPVKKERYGYFLNVWFALSPEQVDDLKHFLKLEQDLIRFQIIGEKKRENAAPAFQSVSLSEISQLELSDDRRRDFSRDGARLPQDKKVFKAVIPEKKYGGKREEKDTENKIDKKKTAEHTGKKTASKLLEEEMKAEKQRLGAEKTSPEPVAKPDKEMLPPEKKWDKAEEKTKGGKTHKKKITLEELDQRLDDILNEEIL